MAAGECLAFFLIFRTRRSHLDRSSKRLLQDHNIYKASVQSSISVSMETFIFLPLSTLVSFLVYFAFPGVSGWIARRRKSITNDFVVRKESNLGTNVDKYNRPTRIFIPKMLPSWPWPRRVNPHYAAVKKEADAWMASFQVFGPKARDAYNRCDFGRCFPSYTSLSLILFDRSSRLSSSPYNEQR